MIDGSTLPVCDTELGPINYVLVTFDATPVPTNGLAALQELADSGRIVVLDVEFIAKQADGSAATLEAARSAPRTSPERPRGSSTTLTSRWPPSRSRPAAWGWSSCTRI